MSLDPRNILARDGLAAAALEGVVAADRYAPTRPCVMLAEAAMIRRDPSPDAVHLDQLLFGEAFEVLCERDGFALGQAVRDGYVGWVEAATLGSPGAAPTHRVRALRTFAFARADMKSPVRAALSLNSLAVVTAQEGRFLHVEGLGWCPAGHLAAIGEAFETDPAAVAMRFLGAPYLWGGRSSLGLDCSGLVQQAFYACGRSCPRDADQQRALGTETTREALGRSDLVFWRGHVGIMLDGERLLHANAHHMAVAVEALDTALARIATADGGDPLGFRSP